MKKLFGLLLSGLLLLPSHTVYAVCSSPAGVAGEIEYSAADNMFRYCDDTNWVDMSGTPTSGLVGHWKLDETTGSSIADSSTNSNTGTWSDGVNNSVAEETATGRVVRGIDFDGSNDYIDVGNDASINGITSAITVAAWVNIDLATPLDVIVSNSRDCCGTYNGFQLEAYSTDRYRWILWNGATRYTLVSNTAVTPGTWQHVVGVYDGAQTILYINGTQDNFANYTGDIGSPASFNTAIGRMGTGAWPLNGKIDDVRIYNRALSATEVSNLYQGAGGSGACANAGEMSYDSTNNVMVWCSGTVETTVGPASGAGGGGCTNPAGSAGSMNYDSTDNVQQYCDGTEWVTMGKVAPTTNGLVGHWRLDESGNTSTAADSANANNGTLTNFPADPTANWVAGQDNNALDFDGTDDRVDLGAPVSELEMGTGDITIMAWIKLDSTTAAAYSGIGTKGAGSGADEGYTFMHQLSNDTINFWFSDGAGTRLNANSNTSLGLADDTWHHVAAVADRDGVATFYMDGTAVGTEDISGLDGVDVTNSGKPFLIGTWGSGTTNSFMGTIDDLRIYNRILGANEINAIYLGTGGS